MISMEEVKKFLEKNNCKVKIKKTWENNQETGYAYVGYLKDNLIFDMNEFYIPKTVKLDVLNSDVLELINTLKDNEWVYSLFIDCEGTYPLTDLVGKDFRFDRMGLPEPPDC